MGVTGRLWMFALLMWAGRASAGVTIDWAKGLVTADAVGIADRHAPSPAAARGPSRRVAEEAAKVQIAAALRSLPLASGGVVADQAADRTVKDRIARAVSASIAVDADPQTDGAWRVTLGVPLEAIREAIYGRRTLPADGDSAPQVVVVTGVSAKPSLGWKVGGIHVPTLWVATPPAWAKDAPRIRATKVSRGAIEIAEVAVTESTLVVIQTGR